ncbi:unnamed protein product [Linum tenue]|uniref:BTB/POZ and MATH domain-containing protein 3 n=1 Tax=Linum tenue TaxID=586396 RepID=A0AAV0JQB5_9ROSI|nr:unnamed protein product [Linum tenue]
MSDTAEMVDEFKPEFEKEPSCSKSVNETVNGSHQFTIKGYSLAKGMGSGKCISSDIFTVGGYDWAIYFYPDGKNPEDSSMYVSVFIALASDGTDVRALFELTLLDQSGKGKHKVHSHFDRALESGPYTLKYKGSMWGYKRFFRRTSLETSDYIKNDCLIMNCTVGVVRTRLEGPKQYSVIVPQSSMGQGLKEILEAEVGCDIVFRVGDESFRAHKLILAARSPVFRAQFFGLVGDRNLDEVTVNDIDPTIFKAMLLFIYTDKIPEMHDVMDSSSSTGTSTNMIQHLLAAADLYNLDRLKVLCESKLCEELTAVSVATTLALAEQHQCAQLKAVCLKFAANPANLGVVTQSEGFRHLEQSCPALVCELLKTLASADEDSSMHPSRKRGGSSIFGLDIAAAGEAADDGAMLVIRIRASCEFTFLDESGKEILKRLSGRPSPIKKGCEWVLEIKEANQASKCVQNDCIIIRGTVRFLANRHEEVEGAKQGSITVPDSNFGQGFKELLESEVGWDIVFHVGDEAFRAHKSILAARSPVFRAQFFGPAGDPNLNEVTVDDILPSIFKAILRFIYTDQLPDVHDIVGFSSSSSVAANITQHLLVAADLYNLDRLKVFCESKLCKELTAESVATTLALAEQHQCAHLKAVCLKFAAHPKNLGVVMKSEGFKHLEDSCPALLRELLKTIASTDDSGARARPCRSEPLWPSKQTALQSLWSEMWSTFSMVFDLWRF